MGRGRADEKSRTDQVEHQIEGAVAIESSELRQCERDQDQNRACHLEQEIDHLDRPLDTGIRIFSVTWFLMIRSS